MAEISGHRSLAALERYLDQDAAREKAEAARGLLVGVMSACGSPPIAHTPATDAELAALVMEVLKDPAAYRRLIGRLRPKLVGRPHPRRRLPRLRGCLPSDLLAEGDREAKRIQLRPLRESHKLWSLAYRRREGLMAHADLTAAELFDAAVS